MEKTKNFGKKLGKFLIWFLIWLFVAGATRDWSIVIKTSQATTAMKEIFTEGATKDVADIKNAVIPDNSGIDSF